MSCIMTQRAVTSLLTRALVSCLSLVAVPSLPSQLSRTVLLSPYRRYHPIVFKQPTSIAVANTTQIPSYKQAKATQNGYTEYRNAPPVHSFSHLNYLAHCLFNLIIPIFPAIPRLCFRPVSFRTPAGSGWSVRYIIYRPHIVYDFRR
jgi:hypothetical protein